MREAKSEPTIQDPIDISLEFWRGKGPDFSRFSLKEFFFFFP